MLVLGHADGLCSIYVHEDASIDQAVPLIVDAKTNYPAACNSVETLLLHEASVDKLCPALFNALVSKGVHIKASGVLFEKYGSIFPSHISLASAKDFDTEYIDLIVAVKTVASTDEAIDHINTHGSRHTDVILTESPSVAEFFMDRVDSAGVYWNASSRFADGYRYGFGAEIGVSTNKTHARGPVGLEGLLIYKYKLYGQGHCVSWYAGAQGKQFKHKPIE